MRLFTQTPEPIDFWSANAADWLSGVGTVTATVVALGFGISALRTAQKDKKVREVQAARDKARVYCWAGAFVPAFEKGGAAFVRNDTDLPIHHLTVSIFAEPLAERKSLNMGTSFMLQPKEIREIKLEAAQFDAEHANPRVHITVTFTDVDGFTWTRHPSGALTPAPYAGSLQMPTPLDKGRPFPE
jgi:hypothetical protein